MLVPNQAEDGEEAGRMKACVTCKKQNRSNELLDLGKEISKCQKHELAAFT